jgi:hypothetical protein
MTDYKPDFNSINSIAYSGNLREQLATLHEMLGVEVTDIASNASQYGIKFSSDAEKVLTYMSTVASKLTLALMEAKQSKQTLTPEEQVDYDKVKGLTAIVGNLQDKLNRLIKTMQEVNELNLKINEQGMELGNYIMDAQEEFRNVRSRINAYGFFSANPELSYLFDEQSSDKNNNEQLN